MQKTILILDDDVSLVEVLKEYLGKLDFRVLAEHSPRAGLRALETHAIDLVILDIMLPEKDGIEVCKEIRAKSDVPVMMLTARGDVTDRIIGLKLGADDYVSKPFEPRELVARIEAILRRPRFIEKRQTFRFRDLEIHLYDRSVKVAGEVVDLTTMEFEILALLASRPGVVFSRDEIIDHIRGVEHDPFSRTIDVVLSKLRAKLKDDPKRPRFIKTVWGSGYTFLGVADGEYKKE